MLLDNFDQTLVSALDTVRNNPIAATAAAAGGLAALYALYRAACPGTNVPAYKGGDPLIGVLRELGESAKTQRTHHFMEHLSRVLGPVGRFRFLWMEMYIVSDPLLAREILNDTETYGRAEPLKLLFGLLGKSTVIGIEGPEWKKHRKVISGAFTNTHLNASMPKINEVLETLFPIWDSNIAAGTPTEVYKDISTMALDALGHAVLGVDFKLLKSRMDSSIDNGRLGNAGKMMDKIMLGMQARMSGVPPIMWPYMKDGFDETVKEVRSIIEEILDAKAEALKASGERQGDLLEAMLSTTEAGVSKSDIIDDLMIMFIAGQDTSANSIVWTLMLLSQNPDKKKNLQDELDSILGKTGVPATSAQIQSMTYLDAVIKESLRLYGPLPVTERRTKKPVLLGGKWQIPAGQEVIINFRVMARDPTYFPDPEAFRPERWLDAAATRTGPPAYMPFGAGPFMCVGMRFANLNMRMALSRIIQRYDFDLVPGQSLREVFTMTMGLKNGLKLEMRRRV
ncbi:hypothetical protein HK104_008124 [Borealophlyctis nickersoniae]|nr:hypothetical protein HK104_008124 [Borealophlyctis nickersoniae]